MQPFQCDLQAQIPKHPITTHTQAHPKQLEATVTMRQKKKKGKPTAAAPAAQTRYLSSPAAATLHGKTTFRAPASSPKQSPCNIMQPFQCDLQARIPKHPITTHTQAHPKQLEATVTMRQKKKGKPTAAAPAAQTRYLSSPAAATLHGKTQGFVLRLPPQLTTSLPHRFPSSPLPFVTTSLRHHFPSSPLPFVTTPLHHHFPSSPLPFVTTPLHHHFPSSPLPIVTTSLRHHFPSSPLPIVTTSLRPLPIVTFPSSPLPIVTTSLRPLPIVTTSLRHHFPSSPLPFVTTSHRHHFPSSPLPIVTTSLRHHFPSSPLPFVTFHVLSHHPSSRSSLNVMYCYVMKSLTPPFIKVKSQCDVLLCHVKSHTTLHQGPVSMSCIVMS